MTVPANEPSYQNESSAINQSDTIRMIRDSAAAVVPPGNNLRRIRDLRFGVLGYDPAVFAEMGQLSWITLLLPDENGDAAFGVSEYCALVEELGAGLVPEPLIAANISVALLRGSSRPDLLARVSNGIAFLPVAWQERSDLLSALGTADAPRVFVPMAAGAEGYLIPIRDSGSLSLYLCEPGDVEISRAGTQDGGHYVSLHPKRSFVIGEPIAKNIGPSLEIALDRAALATAAYLLGVMEAAFALTLAYLKTRTQFGRSIGSFQVLQHRAADLKIQLALTRASVEKAANDLDGASPSNRALSVSRAKARASEASLLVTRQAIQLHGGIGYTDEYDIGLFLRKAMVLANQYGSARLHRARYMSLAPVTEEG